MSDSGLTRTELSKVSNSETNIFIVGVIIAKQRPRYFGDDKAPEADRQRAVWNFTLRDSPMYYANVTCWGSKDAVASLNSKFHLGDVVDIMRPQIENRRIGDPGENFRPKVTAPFNLVLSDNLESKLIAHEGNGQAYAHLLQLPTKPVAGAYTLADVHNLKEKKSGVDLFGVVKQVGKVRNITTRGGIEQQVREVMIFDQTSAGLKITIWDPDLIIKAGAWMVGQTILFVTDVLCSWSDFARSMVASLTSCSIVTENPVAQETEDLRKYASGILLQPSAILDQASNCIPDVAMIQNVMNVQQVLDKADGIMNSKNCSMQEQQFTALLYAVVTQLDLDGSGIVTTTRCSHCDSNIVPPADRCSNVNCAVGAGQKLDNPNTNFDIRLMLSDQTGSLSNCRLKGQIAENVLNCTIQQFLSMNDDQKSVLKWKILMERCAVRILVVCMGFREPIVSILSCELASPLEVANRIPHS